MPLTICSNIGEDTRTPSPTAYLPKAMQPIYDEVHPIRGPKAPQKRMTAFSREVSKASGVWIKVHESIEKSTLKLFLEFFDDLTQDLNKVFDAIHMKFNIVCDDTVVKDEREKQLEEDLRGKLAKNLIEAKDLMDGDLRRAVEGCKAYSKESSLFVE